MSSINDEVNFNFDIDKVINILNDSKYKNRYKIYCTFLGDMDTRWNKRSKFETSLAADGLNYFAYIKFYLAQDGKKYALVAGKTGSTNVNKKSDVLFSTNPSHGPARKWLKNTNNKWCVAEILVINTITTEKDKSNKEALNIEKDLKKLFDLFGS